MAEVIISQPEFGFRPTGGSYDLIKDCKSDRALIQSIRGRTVSWNQLINVTYPYSTTIKDVTFTAQEDGGIRVLGTATGSSNYIGWCSDINVISDHRYYIKEYGPKFPISSSNVASFQLYYSGILLLNVNENATKDSAIARATGSGSVESRIRIQSGNTYDFTIYPSAIDLTLIYGAGNEPSTPEAFEADYERWFGKPLTYEAYCAGELRNLTATGIKTVGFNQLPNISNPSAQVIGGMQYQLTGLPDDSDDDLVTIDGETVELDSNSKFTPTKSGTLLVQGTYPDACLHFVHSGRRDGEFEEHWESTKNLPITTMTGKLLVDGQPSGQSVVVAPRGIGEVELYRNEVKIVGGKRYYYKNVEIVNLPDLTWSLRTTGSVNKEYSTRLPCIFKPRQTIEYYRREMKSAPYILQDRSNHATIFPNLDNLATGIYIYTDNSATYSTIYAVLPKSDGTPIGQLIVTLATPEVYLLDEPYQEDSVWSYKCDDWGTEFLLSPETPVSHEIQQSAPLDADILYGSGPMKRYTIAFQDKSERMVEINIEDTATLGQYTDLIGAESPLEISEDDDHDPLLPVRASVARIRVVCDYADVIQIQNDLQWAVSIQREGVVIWNGFLRTDMPDADLAAIPGEVFYIADDLLGCLKSIRKTLPRSRKTFQTLLERTYDFMDNSIPVLDRSGKPWETLQTLSVEPWNWMEQEENGDGIEEDEPDKANVVEQDIVQFLGVCARYWNNRFYLGSLFGTKFYEGEEEQTYDPIDGSTLEWTGFHSMKSVQGMGFVSVESAGKEIEDESVPSFKGNDFTVESYGYLPPQTDYVTAGNNAYFRSLLPIENSGVWLKRFTQATEAGNILGKLGAHILDLDFWETQQTDLKKANFTFSRSLLFVGVGLGKDGTEYPITPDFTYSSSYSPDAVAGAFNLLCEGVTEPVAIFKSPSVLAKDGGFTLKIEYSGISYSVTTYGGNQYRSINSVASPSESYQTVLFTLRFGDKYWGGTMWVDTPVYGMYRSTSVNPFLYVRKDITYEFGGEGMALPVDGVMSGDVELCIYGCFDIVTTEDTSGGQLTYTTTISPEPVYNISKLELQYHAPLSVLDIQNRDSYRCSQRTSGFPVDNAKDVSLSLCSEGPINDNWGWVYSGSNILKNLFWPKLRQEMKPEQLVLRKNVLALSRIRNYATLSVKCEYDDLPFRRVSFLNRTWYPLAVSTNMRMNISEVLMMDITDIMASLPSVGTDEESTGGDTPVVATAAYQIVTLTFSQALSVPATIRWSTSSSNGTATLVTGQTTVSFDAGETIADERDISIAIEATGYTFNITWAL